MLPATTLGSELATALAPALAPLQQEFEIGATTEAVLLGSIFILVLVVAFLRLYLWPRLTRY